MKLFIRVIEARNIPALDSNGFSDPYVKLQLGRQKFRTKVVKKSLNPSWCEEFTFKVDDLEEEILISVLDADKYSYDDFIGQIRVPVLQVFEAKDKCIGTNWYNLQPKNKKSKNKECGEILLTISFLQGNGFLDPQQSVDHGSIPETSEDTPIASSPMRESSSGSIPEVTSSTKEEKTDLLKLANRIAQLFGKNPDAITPTVSIDSTYSSELPERYGSFPVEQISEEHASSSDFQELMKMMEMRDQGVEIPAALSGGVILDQLYESESGLLNSVLFSPDSGFLHSLAEIQRSTDLQITPWIFENNGGSLKRTVTYTKAASKLVKALKTIEEQKYIKADGKTFAVFSTATTPDAPYGKTFKVEVLYCITPGLDQHQSSRLEISWHVNFSQSSIMKGVIENGVKQGIKESFDQYKALVSQNVKPLDIKDTTSSEKDQLLGSLLVETQSSWKLGVQYFANFTVLSTILMFLYLFIHMFLAMPSTVQGLEFSGLDLPDTFGEFMVSGLLVLQGRRMLELLSRFMKARAQKGSDHGVKAKGNGWLLTVALIQGSSLASVDSNGFSDPYVVFTCNGKTKTSSIKFQKADPLWNEIFEFDAMDEPPSVLTAEIFDFDGPFDEATSLGSAEINFLRSNISDLSDIWIPLKGKLAHACDSKLHLRIFLDNNKGCSVYKDYITKMEKEVGKKIKLRSPQTNSAFQKIFRLPPEEFLINDFSCHLKRKMPLQGRLFLSARILGFHTDLFGHKTTFFLLWEDIEAIEVIPPTLSSMGSPIMVVTLRPGRGQDSLHGAKSQDSEGRLKYQFHSFVSFNVAHRTIMALWRSRAMTPEQKVKIVEEENHPTDDESGSFLGAPEDVKMSVVYSSALPFPMSFFMELFDGGEIDRRAMEIAGCLNYSFTSWEAEEKLEEVHRRQIYYRFDKPVSPYGGEVTSTQRKSRLRHGYLVEEVVTLHDVPLGDYFNVQLRYHVEDEDGSGSGCRVEVNFGVGWLKYTRNQKRISKNIMFNVQRRIKSMVDLLEKEYVK